MIVISKMNNNNLNFRSKLEEKYLRKFKGFDFSPVNSTGEIYINRIHSDMTAYETKVKELKEYRKNYLKNYSNMGKVTESFNS